jgi:hypothetical protein
MICRHQPLNGGTDPTLFAYSDIAAVALSRRQYYRRHSPFGAVFSIPLDREKRHGSQERAACAYPTRLVRIRG